MSEKGLSKYEEAMQSIKHLMQFSPLCQINVAKLIYQHRTQPALIALTQIECLQELFISVCKDKAKFTFQSMQETLFFCRQSVAIIRH